MSETETMAQEVLPRRRGNSGRFLGAVSRRNPADGHCRARECEGVPTRSDCMKILLDECVPKDLCKSLADHECHSARRAGFGGKKNGELLAAAELAGYDVLLTVDRNIPHQQNLAGRRLALLIMHVESNKLSALTPHVPACLDALRSIRPGQVLRIGSV